MVHVLSICAWRWNTETCPGHFTMGEGGWERIRVRMNLTAPRYRNVTTKPPVQLLYNNKRVLKSCLSLDSPKCRGKDLGTGISFGKWFQEARAKSKEMRRKEVGHPRKGAWLCWFQDRQWGLRPAGGTEVSWVKRLWWDSRTQECLGHSFSQLDSRA